MHRSIGNSIADSLELGLRYAQRMLTGVEPKQFSRFARPGGQLVESNHGAFVFGHLTLYPARIFEQLGRNVQPVLPSDHDKSLFSADAKCLDDVDGRLYPDIQDITEKFFSRYRAVQEVLRHAADDEFQKPNPIERTAALFPTLGSSHAFYCGGHLMMHLGQVSAWRRMLGLPPA